MRDELVRRIEREGKIIETFDISVQVGVNET
jgi:tRNA A37 methylthiotransferase MiaB